MLGAKETCVPSAPPHWPSFTSIAIWHPGGEKAQARVSTRCPQHDGNSTTYSWVAFNETALFLCRSESSQLLSPQDSCHDKLRGITRVHKKYTLMSEAELLIYTLKACSLHILPWLSSRQLHPLADLVPWHPHWPPLQNRPGIKVIFPTFTPVTVVWAAIICIFLWDSLLPHCLCSCWTLICFHCILCYQSAQGSFGQIQDRNLKEPNNTNPTEFYWSLLSPGETMRRWGYLDWILEGVSEDAVL
jgi:hypothetical protein